LASSSREVIAFFVVQDCVESLGLLLLGHAHADERIHQSYDHPCQDRRPDQRHGDAEELHRDLARHRLALGVTDAAERSSTENAGERRADDAADAVHREDIERIVDREHALHVVGGNETDDTGDQADDDCAHRPDEARGRRDGAESRHHAGDDAEHGGLSEA